MYTSTVLAFLATLAASAPSPATLTLKDITYSQSEVYSTPAHLATYGGDIAFNLTNCEVKGVAHCSAHGMHLQDMFYGEFNYTCDSPAGVTTNFTFSRPDNLFNVNQTWTKHGVEYLARGSGSVDLTCNTTFWQNGNWTPNGGLYSTTNVDCQPAQLVIKSTVSAVA